MTAPELKPCPFCGGDAELSNGFVSCAVCVCAMPLGFGFDGEAVGFDDDDAAITKWNRRADLAAVPAQVRVKPLVWEDDGHGNFRAQSVRGGEGVDRIIEPQVIGDDRVTYEAWGIKDSFDDPASAMSAVEAEILSEILAAIEPQPDPRDEQRRALEKVIRNQRVQIKRLDATAEAHWRFVNRVREERLADPRDEVIARMVEAVEGLGAMPEGYCFCSAHRIGDDSKTHEPECRDLRAALAAAKAVQHG